MGKAPDGKDRANPMVRGCIQEFSLIFDSVDENEASSRFSSAAVVITYNYASEYLNE
jgi:hypothetical protein